MPIYDTETFDPAVLPSNLKRDSKDIITMAAMLGWKVHLTSGESVTIISPEERKKYHFGKSGRASVNHTRIKRDLVRFSDPDRLALAAVAHDIKDETVTTAIAGMLGAATEPAVDDSPKPEEGTRKPTRKRAAKKAASVTEPEKPDAVIVSERPMLAKAGSASAGTKSQGYESETTMERKWSDGSKDYRCRWPDCTYTSPERLAPSRHYGQTHTLGQGSAKRPPTFAADVPDAKKYAPNKHRVHALAQFLEAWMSENPEHTPEQIANLTLTWVHEQSHHQTEFAAEREPMSPEQVVDRIRSLLDDGTMFNLQREVREQEDRILRLEKEAVDARIEAATEHARAERARNTLRALTELAQEADDETEEAATG